MCAFIFIKYENACIREVKKKREKKTEKRMLNFNVCLFYFEKKLII